MRLERRWNWLLAALVLGAVCLDPAAALAQDEEAEEEEEEATFTFGVDLDVVTKYIWRGFELNDSFSIQPGVWASAYGFTVALWGQIATDPVGDDEFEADALEEVDLTVSYAFDVGSISLEGGLNRYMYPGFDGFDPTNELFLTASYDHWLGPNAGVYYDLDIESTYFELGVAPEFEVAESLTASVGAIVAFYTFGDNEDFGIESFDAHRFEPFAGLSYDLGGGLSLSAQGNFVIPITDQDESGLYDGFWAIAGIHYER